MSDWFFLALAAYMVAWLIDDLKQQKINREKK